VTHRPPQTGYKWFHGSQTLSEAVKWLKLAGIDPGRGDGEAGWVAGFLTGDELGDWADKGE
jgi:hypothetical protein